MKLSYLAIDEPCQWLLDASTKKFEEHHETKLGDIRELIWHIIDQTLELKGYTGKEPWCRYLVTDDDISRMIGTCAFKTPPDENRHVEIEVFTFPSFEGNGYGTEMACKLVDVAHKVGGINKIVSYSTPDHQGTSRVLEKAGFVHVNEEERPTGKTMWRWEINL